MNEHVNPDYPKPRGCFIEENKDSGECKVIDYPTWTIKSHRWVQDANAAIENDAYSWTFSTKSEAISFCKSENYVVCACPKTDEELAAAKAKREAYWASRGVDPAEDADAADDFDI